MQAEDTEARQDFWCLQRQQGNVLPLLKAVARGTVGWKALKNAEDFPSQQKKKKKKGTLKDKAGEMVLS